MIHSSSDYYFYYYYYYLVILMLLLLFFGVQRLYMYLFFSVRGSQPPGVFTAFLVDRLLYYFRIPRTRKYMYAAFTVITYIQQNHISLCECWMVSQLLL